MYLNPLVNSKKKHFELMSKSATVLPDIQIYPYKYGFLTPYGINKLNFKKYGFFSVCVQIFHFFSSIFSIFLGNFLWFLRPSQFYRFFFKISLKFSHNSHGFLNIFSEIPQNYLHPPVQQEIYIHRFSIIFFYRVGIQFAKLH